MSTAQLTIKKTGIEKTEVYDCSDLNFELTNLGIRFKDPEVKTDRIIRWDQIETFELKGATSSDHREKVGKEYEKMLRIGRAKARQYG